MTPAEPCHFQHVSAPAGPAVGRRVTQTPPDQPGSKEAAFVQPNTPREDTTWRCNSPKPGSSPSKVPRQGCIPTPNKAFRETDQKLNPAICPLELATNLPVLGRPQFLTYQPTTSPSPPSDRSRFFTFTSILRPSPSSTNQERARS